MVRPVSLAVAALLLTSGAQQGSSLARVRLIVTTTAGSVDVNAEQAQLASFTSRVLGGSADVHASATGHTMRLSRNPPGETAEAVFDAVLARISGSEIVWRVDADVAAHTTIAVYSTTDFDQPKLVDRFTLDTTSSRFSSPASLLDSHGVLALDRFQPRLVLAIFYTWYTQATWRDPQLIDHPLQPYSNDNPDDTLRLTRDAHGAGIDAFAVSWQEGDGGLHDRRMRMVLDAAAQSGMRACAMAETYLANPDLVWDAPTDPQTMLDWLTAIVDRFGSHPAYLRIGGRPVILVYASSRLQDAEWSDIRARLRASGRDPLIIGDQYESRLLAYFDGEFQYNNVALSYPYADLDDAQGLRTRTFHLLKPGDRRRIFMASVTPGYDDHMVQGRTPLVVDRANGRVYDDMWSAAIDTQADWVILTSWNEWWENTEIEPGERYGSFYLDRTRFWIDEFKHADAPPDHRIRQPLTGPP